MAGERLVTLGRVTGAFGVQGWIRLRSDTDPAEAILEYRDWLLGHAGHWEPRTVIAGRRHGAGVVARIAGCEDRDAALALGGAEIAVERSRLPPLPEGEYYWTDLIGLRVSNREGREFGEVVSLIATGANDVLVVRGDRERLIPFVPGHHVVTIDLERGRMVVDWVADD